MIRVASILASTLIVSGSSGVRSAVKQTQSTAQFDVTVVKSQVMPLGQFGVDARAGTVHVMKELFRGRTPVIRVEVRNGSGGRGVLSLLLDSGNRVTQVDLAVSVPGKTIARTIAWTAADVARFATLMRYENGRLRLVSQGAYDGDSRTSAEIATMKWAIDIDSPVVAAA